MAALSTVPVIPSDALARPDAGAGDWGELLLVSATVTAEVPIAKLTVRELFRLQKGSLLAAAQFAGAPVPISVSAKVFAWGEFQVAGDHLALRIAELT